MNTGYTLIDPPVNYLLAPVPEIEAWRKELEAMPDAPNIRREIGLIDSALKARAEGLDKIAEEWGLS
jgi:hypothetical protein